MMTRQLLRLISLSCSILVVWLAACSDPNSGSNGSGASGSNTPPCTAAFCLDNDQKPGAVPDHLVFPATAAGQSQTLELRISNIGNRGNLVLQSYTFEPATDEFSISDLDPSTPNVSLAPAQNRLMHVVYTPKAGQLKALNLVFATNSAAAAGQHFTVPITVQDGGSALYLTPNPADFGDVDPKLGADKVVQVFNAGNKTVQLASAGLSPTGSTDFTITKMPDLTAQIPPGTSASITVHYAPTMGDKDQSALLVSTTDLQKASGIVLGREIAPDLVSIPGSRDFGGLAPGGKITAPLKLLNQGAAKVHISQLEFFMPKWPKSKVTADKQGPIDLDAGQGVVLSLSLVNDASEIWPNDGAAIGALKVHSDDPKFGGILSVPLFAHTEVGILVVNPSDVVEFGFAAKGVKTKQTVQVTNLGSAPVDISKLSIDSDPNGEFSIVSGNFKPTLQPPASETLAPSGSDAFEVQFAPNGPTGADVHAKLHILSNDGKSPDYVLDLHGKRADGAECAISMSPPVVNYGLLPYGTSKTLSVTLTNIGSGYCQFADVHALDCFGDFSLLGTPNPSVCKAQTSPYFHTFAPSTKLFNLAPGQSGQMQVIFDAPDSLGSFGGGKANKLTDIDGLLVFTFTDAATGGSKYFPSLNITDQNAVKAAAPNLVAKVGKADVQVLPAEIDFGIVSVGCKSPVQTVTAYNIGTTNVYITKVETQGCGPEVVPVNWPGIPKTGLLLTSSTPAKFGVQYGPQNTGKDSCQLVVFTDMVGQCADATGKGNGKTCTAPTAAADCGAGLWCMGTQFSVPLNGEGTLDTEWTDEFDQADGKKVDVVFIIDNSPSMGNKQNELAQNMQTFVGIATLWQNDYHIGVVTTDMDDSNQSGKFQDTKSGVRIVTNKTAPPEQLLLELAKQGEGGSSTEQGLIAALTALTQPLVADSQKTAGSKACTKNSDCQGGAECVKGADDGLMFCGGHNRTFHRKNVALEVVALGDEDDQSPDTVDYYANAFYGINGINNKNLFHFHAITGDPGNGCQQNGGADPGDRFYDLTVKTGGKFGSICSSNYAQILKDIGNAAFALTEQYFLTRTPEPSTIDVTVGGKPCAKGANSWSYDAASNSVSFVATDKGGLCMPQKGDKIKIHYKMLCYP